MHVLFSKVLMDYLESDQINCLSISMINFVHMLFLLSDMYNVKANVKIMTKFTLWKYWYILHFCDSPILFSKFLQWFGTYVLFAFVRMSWHFQPTPFPQGSFLVLFSGSRNVRVCLSKKVWFWISSYLVNMLQATVAKISCRRNRFGI